MIITVEPGVYIPDENLGLRIEDDVLITQSGYEVLSAAVPKEADDIEELMMHGAAPEFENVHRKYKEIISDRSRDGR
jgi:hypothetical protein